MMKSRKITLIVAMDKNRVIGYHNQLPWQLPADLKHFKRRTLGMPVIMGRKTYESIGKPLAERRNIILSRQRDLVIPGCEVVGSWQEMLKVLHSDSEIMVIGGAAIFQQALAYATHMSLTFIDHEFVGDTFFPQWNENEWLEVSREIHEPDEKNPYHYEFVDFERVVQ